MKRPVDLKHKGINFFESDLVPQNLKLAAWYLQLKFENISDEEFLKWLKLKLKEGFMDHDEMKFERDVHTKKYAVMRKNYKDIVPYITEVIDLLAESNSLLKEELKSRS